MNGKALATFLLFLPTMVLAESTHQSPSVDQSLKAIRNRLSSQKNVAKNNTSELLEDGVAFTVLPNDTHILLSRDITGTIANTDVFRKFIPEIIPGKRFMIPRKLVVPALADPRLEPIVVGSAYKNLWNMAKININNQENDLPSTVRNIQRLNGITDPAALKEGATIFSPRGLLSWTRPDGGLSMHIRTDYSVSDVKGLERRMNNWEIPTGLRDDLVKKSVWGMQKEHRDIDLVVIHSTEHGDSVFSNIARYLQRERLANYLISENGEIHGIVPEEYRSFGCGQSLWEGLYSVDHQAINIEIAANTAPGGNYSGITSEQYVSLNWLLSDIMSRRPSVSEQRILTHAMVALNYSTGSRSRKGDPYVFDWERAGLPDNSKLIDPDVRLGRAKLCMDKRYSDRVTPGQEEAHRLQRAL